MPHIQDFGTFLVSELKNKGEDLNYDQDEIDKVK